MLGHRVRAREPAGEAVGPEADEGLADVEQRWCRPRWRRGGLSCPGRRRRWTGPGWTPTGRRWTPAAVARSRWPRPARGRRAPRPRLRRWLSGKRTAWVIRRRPSVMATTAPSWSTERQRCPGQARPGCRWPQQLEARATRQPARRPRGRSARKRSRSASPSQKAMRPTRPISGRGRNEPLSGAARAGSAWRRPTTSARLRGPAQQPQGGARLDVGDVDRSDHETSTRVVEDGPQRG